MKIFTIDEANGFLPGIIPKLESIKRSYESISSLREPVKAAAAGAEQGGGGMKSGSKYVKSLYQVGKLTTELAELGVQLKDHTRGLIDFPAMRDGQVILLCWQLGEEPQINWWHEVEAGFAGRKPL